jgi:hypothetical protein
MLEVLPYEPLHMHAIAAHPGKEDFAGYIDGGGFAEQVTGPAWTIHARGVPVCCAGFQMPWRNRSVCWAVMSPFSGRWMTGITRIVRRHIEEHDAERIEAHTRSDFEKGKRWLPMLGFEHETTLRKFIDGHDYEAFVLIKDR